MTREKRLEKAYKVAYELTKHYTFENYIKLMRLCQDDIFYCEGEDNDFYLEDDHFTFGY